MGLFKDALAFPFKPFKRLWWFWINIIPIVGSIFFTGYIVNINKRIVEEELKTLPAFEFSWETFKLGVLYIIISVILTVVNNFFLHIPRVGLIPWAVGLLIIPFLLVHYSVTREFKQGFNIILALRIVFGHFLKYLKYNLLIIALILIWFLASLPLVTLLITIPAIAYGSAFLYAHFYRETTQVRKHKKHY